MEEAPPPASQRKSMAEVVFLSALLGPLIGALVFFGYDILTERDTWTIENIASRGIVYGVILGSSIIVGMLPGALASWLYMVVTKRVRWFALRIVIALITSGLVMILIPLTLMATLSPDEIGRFIAKLVESPIDVIAPRGPASFRIGPGIVISGTLAEPLCAFLFDREG